MEMGVPMVRIPLWFRLAVSMPAAAAIGFQMWMALSRGELVRLWTLPLIAVGWFYASPNLNMVNGAITLVFVPILAAIGGGAARAFGLQVSDHWWSGVWFSGPTWLITSFAMGFGAYILGDYFERVNPTDER
jgi:hypothetical protein